MKDSALDLEQIFERTPPNKSTFAQRVKEIEAVWVNKYLYCNDHEESIVHPARRDRGEHLSPHLLSRIGIMASTVSVQYSLNGPRKGELVNVTYLR